MKEQKSFIKKIPSLIGVILCIFLVPILVMNVTIIAKSYINPDKVPDFFGIKPFIVLTGSMEKEIYAGDLVITKEVEPSTLEVGDIISYKIDESVITHRILEFTQIDGGSGFITKGDANNVADTDPVTYSQVEGQYLFKIPKLGNLAMYMQTPVGMLIFVGIPLCAFILYDIIRRRLQDRKDKAKDEETQAEIESLKAQLSKSKTESDDQLDGSKDTKDTKDERKKE